MCNDNNDMTCIITTDIHAAINTLQQFNTYYRIDIYYFGPWMVLESNEPTQEHWHSFYI